MHLAGSCVPIHAASTDCAVYHGILFSRKPQTQCLPCCPFVWDDQLAISHCRVVASWCPDLVLLVLYSIASHAIHSFLTVHFDQTACNWLLLPHCVYMP